MNNVSSLKNLLARCCRQPDHYNSYGIEFLLENSINLFESLFLSYLDATAIFLQKQLVYRIDKFNNWDINACFFRTKNKTELDLFLETKIVPGEPQITKVSSQIFSNKLQQAKAIQLWNFYMIGDVVVSINGRLNTVPMASKSKSKWTTGAVLSNWNAFVVFISISLRQNKYFM